MGALGLSGGYLLAGEIEQLGSDQHQDHDQHQHSEVLVPVDLRQHLGRHLGGEQLQEGPAGAGHGLDAALGRAAAAHERKGHGRLIGGSLQHVTGLRYLKMGEGGVQILHVGRARGAVLAQRAAIGVHQHGEGGEVVELRLQHGGDSLLIQ